MPRPQLKFGDMEPIVLFDSIGARAVPNGPMGVTSQLSFTNPASSGIEAPSFSVFDMLNTGNPSGTQIMRAGRQLSASGFFEGPAPVSALMVPLATSSTGLNKLYCATPWNLGVNIEVLNQSTGAVIIPPFNANVGTIQAVYASKLGTKLVIAGGNGLTILDTTTDTLTPVPGTLGFQWCAPYISENDAFIMAVKIVNPFEIHYFTGAGAFLASYVNPPGTATPPTRTHLLATDSLGTNAWLIYNSGTSQRIVQFVPGTGAIINNYILGDTSGLAYVELLYSESLGRLVARWDQGYQLDLLTAPVFGAVNNKTNMPRFVTTVSAQSSMMPSPDGTKILLFSDLYYDSAIRVIDISGVAVPNGDGALSTLNVIAPQMTSFNRVNTTNTLIGVVYSSDMSRVFAGTLSTPYVVYAMGIYKNRIQTNTIQPLNNGTLYLDGSVALPPLRTFYADMLAPAGGSSQTGAPTGYPMGAVRVNRLAPKQIVGSPSFGDGSALYTDTVTFLADIFTTGDVTLNGPGDLSVVSGNAGFFNPFTEFSGAQLEINSPTDVNGAMTFQGLPATFTGVGSNLQFAASSAITSDATAVFQWSGDINHIGPNAATFQSGIEGGATPILTPLGIRVNGYFLGDSITTVAPATDLVLNAVSGDITSSSNFKTINDFECTTPSSLAGGAPADRGLVLKDNAGVRWRVTVSTLGALRVFLA